MSRRVLKACAAGALAAVLLAGCDSGAGDDDASSDSGPDVTSPDAPVSDGALPEGAVGPHGTLLVASSDLALDGVTTDGYAIYTDTSSNTLYAVALAAGSQPITIAPIGTTSAVDVSGGVVFFWTTVSTTTNLGALSIWTHAHGIQALAAASPADVYAASADAAQVLYVDGVSPSTGEGNLVGAGSDGTKTTLVTSIQSSDADCPPKLAFAGSYAIAAFCSGSPNDAGTIAATIESFRRATWTGMTLASSMLADFAVDPAGTEVLTSTMSGLLVYPIAGGSPSLVDGSGAFGTLTKDGQTAIYTTSLNALKRSPVTNPNPLLLVSTGLSTVQALSPDENWVLASLNLDDQTGTSDLYLASATKAGTATILSSATTAGLLTDPFTADSTHALFYTGVAQDVGTLMAVATSGGNGSTLGTSVASSYATSAAKVIFCDNYNAAMGTADLKSADTSGTSAPTLLVTAIDANFFLSAARDIVVYTWSYNDGTMAGLWTLPAP